jgi:flavodoxin
MILLTIFLFPPQRILHAGEYPRMSDIIVAYFSWKGHTEKVAGEIAKGLGAGLVKIEPYGRIHLFSGALKAAARRKSAIKPCKTDLSDTKALVIACPVWARKVPPYINEYLSRISGCNGKPFGIAIEMASAGAENAIAIIKSELEQKGMHFVTSVVTIEKEVDNAMIGEKVGQFISGMQKIAQ